MEYKLGLIGYPLGHSLSPWIHHEFLREAGLSGSYEKFEIAPGESFEDRISGFIESDIRGFNITVPYKETIIPFLDRIDDKAEKMGAVNTVLIEDGKLTGFNTDGSGYVRSLETAYPDLIANRDQKKVLLIGAGGAARGIYYALAATGYQMIDIANRTLTSAEKISQLTSEARTEVLSLAEAERNLDQYDIIIQTTSVGMEPESEISPIRPTKLKQDVIASDIVYKPLETKFLHDAASLGARVHHGHTMLLYQAQLAFEIWTGHKVPCEELAMQLKKILEGAS
ncbi:shikimate dehydrogenase [Aciduricibacillus chroicocephali]|uniref:Shikimate dehydrogenase (NADP(+)) n=1 Tax=Aciduricibacillus chroicocephali TaxID=3054939 RepID=A0ABY9KTN2_9BACI|nr:shikimate dehydrogenase [Bacillaceae bacterium 44XB]